MAFYTDYEEVVPFDTSNIITASAIANAVAAMFVAHTGCTLVKYASLGEASSSSNYAEIAYAGMYVRFLYTNTSNYGNIGAYMLFPSGSVFSASVGWTFPDIGNKTTLVKIRFYNTLSGFLTRYFKSTGAWTTCLTGVELSKISDGTSANAISLTIPVSGGTTYCDDGLAASGGYYIMSATYIGLYDTDGVKQVLNQEWLSPSSATTSAKRYKMNNCYISAAYQETGIVEVDSRYFYINASNAVAFEINS